MSRREPAPERKPNSARIPWLAAAVVFVPAFAIYLRTLHTGVPGPDSGELISVARVLGIAHPPGYPLYTMLAHLFGMIVPWGSYAARINLFSALLHATTAALLCVTVVRLTGRAAAGIAGGLALAGSRPFWKAALVAEVFPLNSLMAVLLWLAFAELLRDAGLVGGPGAPGAHAAPGARGDASRPGRRWPLAVLVLVTALIPAHHHTLLLLALPLDAIAVALVLLPAPWLARRLPGYRRPWSIGPRQVAAGLALVALGLAPLLYLPLAAARGPLLCWGQPATWSGFFALLTRAEYGALSLAPVTSGHAGGASHAWAYLKSIPHDFAWVGAVLALLGAGVLAIGTVRGAPGGAGGAGGDAIGGAGARPLLLVAAGAAALQLAFLARVPFSSDLPYYRGVVERFYVLPDLMIALFAGLGVAALLARLPAPSRALGGVALVALAALPPHFAHMHTVDQRGNRFVEDLGRNVLASLPRDAVLFSVGDIFYNCLLYLTVVEKQRPDVVIADQFLMTRGWYVQELRRRHPGLLPVFTHQADPDSDLYRGDSLSENVRWIDHLRGVRPVAFTGFIDRSYGARYEMVRNGYTMVPYLRGTVPPAGARAEAAARLLSSLALESYFRPQDPRGPEAESRGRTTQLLAGTCFLLCDAEGQKLSRAAYPGLVTLGEFLERYTRMNPIPDPELLRAAGFLYVYHPEFRDRGRAEQALGRYLALAPVGPEADGAQRLLDALREGK